ncbi:hypothetical protein [Vallitalea maricola]|uniref:Uncharacterized protein n=1 Tax=Vallitalea maricola TaxID=3074433 RepID=A0ACB5UEZ7_9FIRM|nr:hypothetical protein AN2V17_04030 [Vallitalea sp. AN17-2]
MIENRFCYKVLKEAGLAYDSVTGEKECAYIEIKLTTKYRKLIGDKYDELHDKAKKGIANKLNIDVSMLIPISEQEYDENAEG